MTRFARAKGAAASNERIEEDATPWHVMAQQMRYANGYKSNSNRDVEDLDGGLVSASEEKENISISNKHATSTVEQDDGSSSDENDYDIQNDTETAIETENNKNSKDLTSNSDQNQASETGKKKKKRNQNKCLNCKEKGHMKRDCPELPEERRKELQELLQLKIERKGIGTGRKKNKKRKSADDVENNEDTSPSKRQKFEKNEFKNKNDKTGKQWDHNSNNNKNKKELKDKTGQIVADGEGLFQGFRVKMEDVKRLKKLQKQLTNDKTIKKDEIDATLKRERRKAERALANYHKMVCFNCRKPGHLLVDCPDTKIKEEPKHKKDSNANTHCFKCGDANHTSKECVSKLKGAEAYRFAVCFICKEVGHLAKSCPDNPKGLYPKGGGCKFCGSVEHLKADCTRKAQKDKRQEVALNTISIKNKKLGIEEIDMPAVNTTKQFQEKQRKIVSF